MDEVQNRAPLSARRGRGGVGALGMALMTMCTYLYTVVAAHMVGPTVYGEFSAAVNVLVVLSVAALGLQATAARLLTTHPGQAREIERRMVGLSVRVSAVVTLAALVLSPLLHQLLRMNSWGTTLLLVCAIFPTTLIGGMLGVLQGERRWWSLAAMYVANGVPRLLVGTALLVWQPSATSALLGVFIGAWCPVLVGVWAMRAGRNSADTPGPSDLTAGSLRDVLRNAGSLLAFLAISSLDVVVARAALDAHDAGVYAAGSILVRGVLVLPQMLLVMVYPDLAQPARRQRTLRRSLVFVAAIGTVGILVTAAASRWVLLVAGGEQFSDVEQYLWAFILLGVLLAMVQLLIYADVAAQRSRALVLVWTGLAALVALGFTAGSVGGLLRVVLAVDTALLLLLFVAATVGGRRRTASP